jgi:hypothetical protein
MIRKVNLGIALLLVNLTLLFFWVPAPVNAAIKPVIVKVDGNDVNFPDQQPYVDLTVNRTYIPLRTVAEYLGGEVSWNGKTAYIKKPENGVYISMQVGSKNPFISGVTKSLDAPAVSCNNRIMVPVRFISEVLGCRVDWDQTNNTVNIYTQESVLANTRQEFEEIKKVIPDIQDGGRSIGKGISYWVVLYPSTNEFQLVVGTTEENLLLEVKKILQVFYPTKYEEAYNWMMKYQDHKDTYDGRKFNCDIQCGQWVIIISGK